MRDILSRLRELDVRARVGELEGPFADETIGQFIDSGVRFVGSHDALENVYYHAVHDLARCVAPAENGKPMLIEGADFIGCWLESTGTINSELLSRFCPGVAQSSFELFADYIRDDGLIPYKHTDKGPGYRQVQMVTPLARSVWRLYRQNGDKQFLRKMYDAIARNDQWLAEHRDTRGTGCVEAFCTFDTGHDASPRFWHVPDVPAGDPAKYDEASPILPFLAPDMTANVYCQRKYLHKMAQELNLPSDWDKKAQQTHDSLMKQCYDEQDRFFYDRDKLDRFVRIQTDNLMRVYACEAGDDEMFEDALSRYFLNTRKFFPRYPLTTIAIDDPRFLQAFEYNAWSGQLSFLTESRLPAMFDHHRRHVELTWILHPILTALSRFERFAGSLNIWVGAEGYKENYTPTMVCLLDYLERMSGIFPTPDRTLWFTALVPTGVDYGQIVAEQTGYSRRVDGALFELVNDKDVSQIYLDQQLLYTLPRGVRLVTDRSGKLLSLIGMVPHAVTGTITYQGQQLPFTVSGNEQLDLVDGKLVSSFNPGVVPPNYG
ncbi:hypothetical protein LJC33_06025 [Eubacteriales bacterium OttesenSCG-928-N13]|nr:hypothetical protein [Eubacteriales bacterium OttesenSCG-928-N13]